MTPLIVKKDVVRTLRPKTFCHVCGEPLTHNMGKETESCVNKKCPIQGVNFNIFVEWI